MRDTIDMAREVKMPYDFLTGEPINLEKLKAFEALVRADERQAAAPTVQEPDHGDELTIAYMSGVHRGKELAATVQKQVLGFEVVLDESLPPNTMKFVQPAPVHQFDHASAANSALRDAQNRSYQIAKLSQPAPVPLTDEQIDQIIKTAPRINSGYVGWILDQRRVWARAIEAAHGITKGQP